MQLVLFTAHYPYSGGEPFLEDEIYYAETVFERIVIFTAEKNTKQECYYYYVPKNAEVIAYRQDMKLMTRVLRIIPLVLQKHFWRELIFAKQSTSYSLFSILRGILVDESLISFLRKSTEKWLLEKDPNNMIFYSYWLDGAATFLSRCLDKNCIKIARAHGGDCFFDRGYHPYRREQLHALNAVFSISEAGRKDIIQHYKNVCVNLEKKVFVSRLGIKIDDKLMNPWCRKPTKTIVSCSNVIPLKRLDLLIDSLSEITDLQIRWIHFGDGNEMNHIKEQAKIKLGKKRNITYKFEGRRRKCDIFNFYQTESIDLFINCSDYEGIPVSMMEAMFHGIPVIARDVGGISELLNDTCGILLPQKVLFNDLTNAILKILMLNNDEYCCMRLKAKEHVKMLYRAQSNYTYFFENMFRIRRKND